MWWFALGFILSGIVWVIICGQDGVFDYTPTAGQVSPETLKWFAFFFWWVMFPVETLLAIGRGLIWLNKRANKFLNVRS